jgi:hypothetical protein
MTRSTISLVVDAASTESAPLCMTASMEACLRVHDGTVVKGWENKGRGNGPGTRWLLTDALPALQEAAAFLPRPASDRVRQASGGDVRGLSWDGRLVGFLLPDGTRAMSDEVGFAGAVAAVSQVAAALVLAGFCGVLAWRWRRARGGWWRWIPRERALREALPRTVGHVLGVAMVTALGAWFGVDLGSPVWLAPLWAPGLIAFVVVAARWLRKVTR